MLKAWIAGIITHSISFLFIFFHCISKNRRNDIHALGWNVATRFMCTLVVTKIWIKFMEMQELRVASLDAFWDSLRISVWALSVNFSFAYGNVTNKLNVEIYVTLYSTALYVDILHSCKRNGTKMMTHTIFKSNCFDSILNSKKRRQFTQKKKLLKLENENQVGRWGTNAKSLWEINLEWSVQTIIILKSQVA